MEERVRMGQKFVVTIEDSGERIACADSDNVLRAEHDPGR